MSMTFTATDSTGRPLRRCDCLIRWCNDCETAYAARTEEPETYSCDVCDNEINLSNGNACNLLGWIGVTPADEGTVPARELVALCRRRLWDEARNHDPALASSESAAPGSARVITCGRRPGYLRERTADLLRVAETAGDQFVSWD